MTVTTFPDSVHGFFKWGLGTRLGMIGTLHLVKAVHTYHYSFKKLIFRLYA